MTSASTNWKDLPES